MLGFDKRLSKDPLRYILQCILAGIVTLAFLSFLDLITYIGIVASLGATTFLVFTLPHRASCAPRYVIGGYLVGILVGVLCNMAFGNSGGLLPQPGLFVQGAIAVGSASLLMVITNTEHPPAAGLALSLVLQQWDYRTLLYVIGCVCLLSVAKHFLKRVLIDLL